MLLKSSKKNLHFSEAELIERRENACAMMKARGLDALLLFRQESMYYLTGYDTFGYVFFQTLVLTADGRMVLLARSPDLRQAQFTSVVEDIRIWVDRDDANPVEDLREILLELSLAGARLGVEYDAYGLTARNGRRLDASLHGVVRLEDASDLVSRLRLVKSPAEIAYVRRAAALADDAWQAALEVAGPGVDEGEVLAAMHGAIYRGGGDDPGNEFVIGSGHGAMMCRYYTGRRRLAAQDQLTLEWAGAFRHYHSCLMRTVPIGRAQHRQVELFSAARDALLACEQALQPGRPIGDVFDAHARVLDAAGLSRYRLNACGYSLGTTYAPNWMDWPMLYQGNPVLAEPGQIFFMHMIILDDDAGLAMTLGRTSLVTAEGTEVLSKAPLELVTR